jgi:cyclopropane fatty-acyl-phospholipid synthase-like methyltransferase
MNSDQNQTPQEKKLYDDSHTIISGIINRQFYNSIGEEGFKVIAGYISEINAKTAFDLGSGNGNATMWFAEKCGLNIFGIEPLPVLFNQALHSIKERALSDRIQLENRDFYSASFEGRLPFDIVMGIDTFCYFADRRNLISRLRSLLRASGRIVFTDLVIEEPHPAATTYFKKYNLAVPPRFDDYRKMFQDLGFTELKFELITPRFLAHWSEVNGRVLKLKDEIVSATNEAAFLSYLNSTEIILSGIKDGKVGYVMGVMQKAEAQ